MKRKRSTIIGIAIGVLIVGYIYFTYLYVYRGKVIDADTKKPIEGAVVVASWLEERPTIAGGTTRTKDVKETLTDKDGEWSIRGARGGITSLFSFIASAFFAFQTGPYSTLRPEFIVFKPGYCSYPKGFAIAACKGKMRTYNATKSENIGEVVELPKLTDREDRIRAMPGTAGFSREFDKKQLIFLRLLNKERKNLFGEGDLENYIKELQNEK